MGITRKEENTFCVGRGKRVRTFKKKKRKKLDENGQGRHGRGSKNLTHCTEKRKKKGTDKGHPLLRETQNEGRRKKEGGGEAERNRKEAALGDQLIDQQRQERKKLKGGRVGK